MNTRVLLVVLTILLAGCGSESSAWTLQEQVTIQGGEPFHVATIPGEVVTSEVFSVTATTEWEVPEGEGYLEMWVVLPSGERFFSRSLGEDGSGILVGSAGPAEVTLPFDLLGGPTPEVMEVNAVLPPGGTATVSEVALETERTPWFSQQMIGWGGAILGVLGAAVGILGGTLGRRREATWLAAPVAAFGAVLFLAGCAALLAGQPAMVVTWMLLGGLATATVFGGVAWQLRSRSTADELRRMHARDA